ncbi:MAG: glycosyltransferase family 2 protein [Colwellia sp.]|nr:glycosyltransferase family 2 protein [Colwellia sp.]
MINETPLLSIGMPAYNSEKDICASLDAILDQSFDDFELIISDNASTDGTQAICETYAAKDSRIRYIRNKANVGASDNYNRVFTAARGKYFKWASSNDICAPTFFEKCVDVLENNSDAALAFPRTRLYANSTDNYFDYEESLNTSQERPIERMLYVMDNLRLNNIMNGIFRSDALKQSQLIIPFLASDNCLMAEVALYGSFLEVPEFLFYRQMDEESSTSMQGEDAVREHYNPNSKKPMRFQNWRGFIFYFVACHRSHLSINSKISLDLEIARRMVWKKEGLIRDFLFWKPHQTQTVTDWKAL